MRLTKQRQVILQTLRASNEHPDASTLYHLVRNELPHISLGTVYRNLTQLEQAGHIRRVPGEMEPSRWDGRVIDHGHIACEGCGAIVDVDSITLSEDAIRQVELESGFSISEATVHLVGLCPECRRHPPTTHVRLT